jgi:rubrerythrin
MAKFAGGALVVDESPTIGSIARRRKEFRYMPELGAEVAEHLNAVLRLHKATVEDRHIGMATRRTQTAKRGTHTKVVAWWLSGGEETCPHCGQLYAYEAEFRCPECDGPCCPLCKSRHDDGRIAGATCVDCAPPRRIRHG